MVTIKRAYEAPSRNDGTRILVYRLWSRGLKKEDACVQKWMRALGAQEIFSHNPERWQEFHKHYLRELKQAEARPLLQELLDIARKGKLTLVYSARDEKDNQAVVLKEVLESQL